MKIAIIGSGYMGHRHLEIYSKFQGCSIILNDQDHGLASQLAKSYGVQYSENLDNILSDHEVDAVDICTPTASHAGLAVGALSAGKHVFCEKPLCTSSKDANSIFLSQEKADKLVMVGYIYRFSPTLQYIKKTLDQNVIGDPLLAILRIGSKGSRSLWKHRSDSDGGAKYEMLMHLLDLAYWFFGDINDFQVLRQSTILTTRNISGQQLNVDADDFILASSRYGNGQILYEADLVTPAYMNFIDIQGSNGSIFTSIISNLPTLIYCNSAKSSFEKGHNWRSFPEEDFLSKELLCFLETMRGNETDNEIHSVKDSLKILSLLGI